MPLNMDESGAVTWHSMFNINLIYTKGETMWYGRVT